MEKEFVTYKQALALKELGFNEECFGMYQKNKKIWYCDKNNWITNFEVDPDVETLNLHIKEYPKNVSLINGIHFLHSCANFTAPTYSQAFRWFREKHDLHVQIRKENYFQRDKYEYYHYDISKGEETDITNQEDLIGDIFDECSQDIPGNYLNEEKYSKLIFEKNFAFKTYEEIESFCLDKLIEIVKNEG